MENIKKIQTLAFVTGGISLGYGFLSIFHNLPLAILAFIALLTLGIITLVFTLNLEKGIKGKALILTASIMTIAGFIVGMIPFINSLYLVATGALFLIGAFQLNENLTLTVIKQTKKYILVSVLCGVLGLVTFFGTAMNIFMTSYTTTTNIPVSPKPESTKKPEASTKKEDESTKKNETNTATKHTAGTYKIGTDLPAGEYLLESTSTYASYIESASDSSGSIESIVFNDNVSTILYFTVHEGEYLKVTGGVFYPAAEAASIVQKYIDKEGMFKVGQDIPAGEYKVIPTSSIMGYYEVTSDSTHGFDAIITNENFSESTYISLSDGQYFKVNRATIELV